jgi:hypothetical protein
VFYKVRYRQGENRSPLLRGKNIKIFKFPRQWENETKFIFIFLPRIRKYSYNLCIMVILEGKKLF